ncbi:MAG: tRNA (guanosine(46)-N7)-methyltransferase TrmB [Thermoguttaceae bacterium]|nr:tRNA (guanosine(46)-N7)-methyltransferase TrmB [Thermoguttaceae bacterium]MDW8079232.1 tRNA (guanosine(46)-N7)-methyltransferase TrmB [Thermoguttaceae bacterium]
MGRRALKKIDPELDLSGYLWPWELFPRPWDPVRLFDRQAPLEVEVGSGKGMFLCRASVANPAHDFMGIEIAPKYARFAAARLAKLGVPNAVVVQADALRVFAELLPDESVHTVHIYFPDPWWKKRHRKRRVIRSSFIADLYRTLKPAGVVHLWTDVAEYFDQSRELFRIGGFQETSVTAEIRGPSEEEGGALPQGLPPGGYQTHFERRMRLAAQPVYKAVFAKST